MSPASSQSISRSLRPRTPPLSLMEEIVAWAALVTGLTTYFDIGELTLLIDPSRISLPVIPVSLAPSGAPGAGAGPGTPGVGFPLPAWAPADGPVAAPAPFGAAVDLSAAAPREAGLELAPDIGTVLVTEPATAGLAGVA